PVAPAVLPAPALPAGEDRKAQAEREIWAKADAALKGLKIEQDSSKLRVQLALDEQTAARAIPALTLGLLSLRAGARMQSQDNLRQLALAMHNYHTAHNHLPPASSGGGLSWRVALLPYLGEEKLYKEFHLDESWESEHNQGLIKKMPRVF